MAGHLPRQGTIFPAFPETGVVADIQLRRLVDGIIFS
jgi:hypothetical protein